MKTSSSFIVRQDSHETKAFRRNKHNISTIISLCYKESLGSHIGSHWHVLWRQLGICCSISRLLYTFKLLFLSSLSSVTRLKAWQTVFSPRSLHSRMVCLTACAEGGPLHSHWWFFPGPGQCRGEQIVVSVHSNGGWSYCSSMLSSQTSMRSWLSPQKQWLQEWPGESAGSQRCLDMQCCCTPREWQARSMAAYHLPLSQASTYVAKRSILVWRWSGKERSFL